MCIDSKRNLSRTFFNDRVHYLQLILHMIQICRKFLKAKIEENERTKTNLLEMLLVYAYSEADLIFVRFAFGERKLGKS